MDIMITYRYRSCPDRLFTKTLTLDDFDLWWATFAHDPNVQFISSEGGFAWHRPCLTPLPNS